MTSLRAPSTGTIPLGIDSIEVRGRNTQRAACVLVNPGPSVIYIHFDGPADEGNGYPLIVGGFIEFDAVSNVYAFCPTANGFVGFIEEHKG